MDNGEEQLPRNFEALAKIVMATKGDVARHERAIFGDREHSGLMQIGKEARGAVVDLAGEYREDRGKLLEFYVNVYEPEHEALKRALRNMYLIACGLALVSVALSVAVLVRLM